jgi:hypothetical protein
MLREAKNATQLRENFQGFSSKAACHEKKKLACHQGIIIPCRHACLVRIISCF